jgi:hypothetical protein
MQVRSALGDGGFHVLIDARHRQLEKGVVART